MSDKPWPGPPAGVSNITEGGLHSAGGGRVPVDAPAAKPGAPAARRRQPGDDILANVEQLRKVENDQGMNPAGVRGVRRDIREGKMPRMRRSRVNHTTFRTHDTKGKQLGYLPTQVLYICLRELSLGGSALPILRAFNVNFSDEDGKPFLPVPEALMRQMTYEDEEPTSLVEAFQLGAKGE